MIFIIYFFFSFLISYEYLYINNFLVFPYDNATYPLFSFDNERYRLACTCVCTRPEDRDITLDYLSRPSLSLSDHAIYCTTFEPPYGKGCNN